jgi:uncharacterized membrane protein YeaQ/YmgE (transglycosylase-associated protein family)
MGIALWTLTGIVVWAQARLIVALQPERHWGPSVGLALLGAIIGGFLSDLIVHGDSVMNFRGPTLIGAIVGAIVALAGSFLLARIKATGPGEVARHS